MILLLVALALRVPGLWQFDLWQDEIYSVYEARDLFGSTIGPGGMELRPLYFLLLHPLVDAMPRAVAVLRLPSLLFGLLGIVAVWALARRFFGRWVAIIATTLAVILPLHITESQSIRYWSLIFLLSALFTRSLLSALETGRARDYHLALLWLLLAALTHPTFLVSASGIVLGAHLVRDDGRFGFQWPSRMAWLRLWLPFLGFLLAWYLVLTVFFPIPRMVGESVGSASRLLPALAVALSTTVGAACLAGTILLLRQPGASHRRIGMMAIMGVGLTTLILFAGRTANLLPISVLYLFATFPLLFVVAASLVETLGPAEAQRPAVALTLLVILAGAVIPGTVSHLRDGTRFDYRPAFSHIVEHDPRGTVLVWPRIEAVWHAPDLTPVELRNTTTPAILDSLAAASPHFWAVMSRRRFGVVNDEQGELTRWLDHRCTMVQHREKLRFDWEVYGVLLYECGGPGH